jgi:hypothetical protein
MRRAGADLCDLGGEHGNDPALSTLPEHRGRALILALIIGAGWRETVLI